MNEFNNQNKSQSTEDSLKSEKRVSNVAEPKTGVKRLLAQKWFSPALFMITAAIIVTLLWVYQDNFTDQPTTGTEVSEEGTAVNSETDKDVAAVDMDASDEIAATGEDMQWPVANINDLQIEIPFYDTKATAVENEAALIQVGTTFAPHMGIDFVHPDGIAFDVQAALGGTVTVVEKNPINGNLVEISHGNGLSTVYQSLSDVAVNEGDEVLQGTVIAKAGRNDVESDLGVHLHFEARLNGDNVNPGDYIVE
ncbi:MULTISPECIES: M23 family metallopeptidase [Paenibacillus]|uniref:M23 family metallopeptidase n=1 Tax=Paenibacillus TaxID=44249 RepID=UPI00204237FE|nr:M23 family metallopeptidase [Paenibacillus camelliae]MCM3635248.1 M23 family metallopeptidase [Paenibacillus camelliae]